MKTFLIIDTHALIHRFFHALPPLTSPDGQVVNAVFGVARVILKIFKEQKIDYLAAAFDRPEETFRAKMYKEYKIQRPAAPSELVGQFNKVRDLFGVFGIKVVELAGYEADDLIGSLAEKFKSEPDLKIIILSGDLDTLQLVENDKVVVQFIKKGVSETEIYNEEAVMKRYGLKPSQLPDLKGLLGDASDNIPGVHGVGPKTATPLMQKYGTLENLFTNLWEISDKIGNKLEGQKETALFSKKLATIKRDVSLTMTLEDFKVLSPNKSSVTDYLKQLGFNSLVKDVI